MSFSYDVKEEIARHTVTARHCQIAELSAIMLNIAEWETDGTIRFTTEHEPLLYKIDLLLRRLYNVSETYVKDSTEDETKTDSYRIASAALAEKITESIKYTGDKSRKCSELLLKSSCCRMAYLQGSFLCIGSMSDPEKSYHLEFVCSGPEQSAQLQQLIQDVGIDARITMRKKHYIVYMKEAEAIVEMLGVMGAHKAMMEMENYRILKEVRNSVNRVCNCDSANINKTIRAAEKQSEDIRYLRDHYGFANLPENLREMAFVRLEHPDTPLKELGEYLSPPVGKSGVNHRLRKLSELAEKHREKFL